MSHMRKNAEGLHFSAFHCVSACEIFFERSINLFCHHKFNSYVYTVDVYTCAYSQTPVLGGMYVFSGLF